MSEKPEDQKEPKDLKALMPTERKSVWRTAEERRMSDLTRVLEWLERRKGKKKQPVQVCTVKAKVPEDCSNRGAGALNSPKTMAEASVSMG